MFTTTGATYFVQGGGSKIDFLCFLMFHIVAISEKKKISFYFFF